MRRGLAFYKSIYFRLSLTFAVIVAVAGLIQLGLVVPAYRSLSHEIDQRVNWALASDVAERIQPLLLKTQNPDVLRKRLTDLSLMNPKVEVYITNAEGQIIVPSGLNRHPLIGTLNVETLDDALEIGVHDLPLYLDVFKNRGHKEKVIFSVAKVALKGESRDGYLVLVLNSRALELMTDITGQVFLLKSIAVGALVISVLAMLLALSLFWHLTRNFRRVIGVVSEFQTGNLDKRVEVVTDDEVGYLATTINQMADRIQAGIRERQEFIASVSHDLRSPLTSIKGFVDMLQNERETLSEEQQKSFIDKIYRNVELQHHLVNDLFELSKLNAEEKKASIEPFALGELVDDVCANFIAQSEEKNIALSVSIDEKLPRVLGDLIMSERILVNLLTNAIRYTDEGGSIECRVAQRLDGDRAQVYVCVRDSGIGIPESDLPHLFESFYRVDSARSRSSGGTGLGLAIVKKMVELQDATVWVESEVGVGSSFFVAYPIEHRE